MEFKTIHKDPGTWAVTPNISNYPQAYKEFSWGNIYSELGAVPNEPSMNIAYLAVDRHANGPKRNKLALRWLGADTNHSINTQKVGLGDWLPLRQAGPGGRLITELALPTNVRLAYEYVARTPADQPIVCVALVQWLAGTNQPAAGTNQPAAGGGRLASGRTRLALGGWGAAPRLALDGPEPGGLEVAAQNACSQADDQWASAEYRRSVAATLAKRCLDGLQAANRD